jgi:uncharacterized protein YuzE
MRISYAQHADALYLVFEDTENKCSYIELDSGIICRVDEVSDRVVGITIPDFLRRTERKELLLIPELTTGIPAEQFLQALDGE